MPTSNALSGHSSAAASPSHAFDASVDDLITIHRVKKNAFSYELVYGQGLPTKPSKDDWPCMLCDYNTSKNCDMFQVTSSKKFKRICSSCVNDKGGQDFIDFLFTPGTASRLSSLSPKF